MQPLLYQPLSCLSKNPCGFPKLSKPKDSGLIACSFTSNSIKILLKCLAVSLLFHFAGIIPPSIVSPSMKSIIWNGAPNICGSSHKIRELGTK